MALRKGNNHAVDWQFVKGRVKAFVLVNLVSGHEESSLGIVRNMPEVDSVDVIFGKYDLHITVYFDSLADLDNFVMGKLRTVEGVYQTTTLLSVEM